MADQIIQDLIRDAERMREDRANVDSVREDIRRYVQPVLRSFTGEQSPGSLDRDSILDNTPEVASEMLGAALHGHLTNPGATIFDLRVVGEDLEGDADVARWLGDTTRRAHTVLNAPITGFTTSLPEAYAVIADFGQASLYVDMDRRTGAVRVRNRPLDEVMLGTDFDGIVNKTARWFRLTARQAVDMFGEEAGAEVVKASGDVKRQDMPVEFLHVVLPREDRVFGKLGPKNQPWASITINVTHKHEVRISGFADNPWINPRWRVRPGEPYGRGCGHKALQDSKMLQEMMKVTLRAGQNAVKPPLMKMSDGILTPVRVGPGGVTTVRRDVMSGNTVPIRPLLDGARPDIGEEMMAGVRARIERAYFNHLLIMSRDPRMTATQVLKIDEETLRVMGPFLGRLQVEMLAPLVERVVGLLLRAGALAPVPPALAGRRMRIEFVSPVVRAQRLSEANAITSLYEATGPIWQNNPAVLDNVDEDAAFRLVGDRLGVPGAIMRDVRAVAKRRSARVEVQETDRAVDQFAKVAPAMQSAAQAADGMANDNNARPARAAGE